MIDFTQANKIAAEIDGNGLVRGPVISGELENMKSQIEQLQTAVVGLLVVLECTGLIDFEEVRDEIWRR